MMMSFGRKQIKSRKMRALALLGRPVRTQRMAHEGCPQNPRFAPRAPRQVYMGPENGP